MRLRQIEVFHAVYSSGSMTAAAELLNVSQPSVSKVLAHAEQQLGYLLFDRVKGKLVPTPEAHRLFSHVATVYRDVDRLKQVAANLRGGDTGVIRIAGTPAFGMGILPHAITSFRRNHKDVVFEVETLHFEELTTALLESRIDIGLAFEPPATAGIDVHCIAESRFVVVASPEFDFGDKASLTAADLRGFPVIGLNSRGPLGRILSSYLGPVEDELTIVARSETYHVATALAARGAGITIADEVTARSGDPAHLRILPLRPELKFAIVALHLSDLPLSLTARNFMAHLENSVREYLARRTP